MHKAQSDIESEVSLKLEAQ